MEREKLKTTLTELHAELADSQEPVDEETTALLQQLATDIDRICVKEDESPVEVKIEEHKEGLLDQLLSLTEEFEESHPRLADVIGRVATALSRIGI